MKRIIISLSLYVMISSFLFLKKPEKEIVLKNPRINTADEIINNLCKPSLPVSYEKKN